MDRADPVVFASVDLSNCDREPIRIPGSIQPHGETSVRWAGDPAKPVIVEENGSRLTPRGSFAEWRGLKRMHSVPWSEVNLEAADALRVNLLENALQTADRASRDRETTALRHRIQAMAQTHILLAEGKWVGTSLRRLIEEDVAPAGLAQRGRMMLSGEDLFLSPLEALALSMVLHELLTNALRHGALCTEQGLRLPLGDALLR